LKSISHDILIVADDLTGACDAAAPFAPCVTGFSLSGVRAYSTESRDLTEPEIIRSMQSIARTAGPAKIIFKKIDSTLRGNVQAEIKAAMRAFRCTEAVITPAFPDMGRIVKEGCLHVDGVLTRQLDSAFQNAVTNEDLDQIVDAGLKLPGRVLWAGSAGLAAALARRLYGTPQSVPPPQVEGPVVFCIGSDHPATQAQRIELQRHHPEAKILPIRRTQTTLEEIRLGVAGAAALFITGGDTATMVLQAIGAKTITIKHEVVTGLPWGLLSGGIFDGCPVVTKSGGFGAPDTLVKVANFFTCHNH
jgi:uncharacterized protein YgbK (DUF1537 family)